MASRLIQLVTAEGADAVALVADDGTARLIGDTRSTYELAKAAIVAGGSLLDEIERRGLGDSLDLTAAFTDNRLKTPIAHPDPAHQWMTGTGLTHLGSAEGRDKMHRDLSQADQLTDSMKMFKLGLEGGKPAQGGAGVAPEWFFKGDGSTAVAPGADLGSPDFALDGGEEPEIAGIYVIGPDGTPFRLGFSLANEFSDHVLERQNYLYLAHSKLRPSSFGPEILIGELPADIRGISRIHRGAVAIFEAPFVSGEANMSHSIANLEAHHFKYGLFRQPGDVHVHFFGTATLSFTHGVRTEPGDVVEIAASPFTLPLTNRLTRLPASIGIIRAL
ncbi:MAG: GguC family protein [Ancalomicrobiaceae bacterium]|nr:GguC family protein [Ancalomicrobiaceae bacterium]